MTKKSELTERLIQCFDEGEDPTPIYREYKDSSSTLHGALTDANDYIKPRLRQLILDYKKARENLQEVEEERKELQDFIDGMPNLKEDYEKIEKKFVNKQNELGDLETRLNTLANKGVTVESIEKIDKIEFESGKELLERLTTIVDYEKMVKEKDGLETQIEDLKSEKEDMEKTIDDDYLRLGQFRKSAKTIKPFFEEGYSEEHFQLLLEGLWETRLSDKPEESITRFLKAIDFNKKLHKISDEVKAKELEKANLGLELIELAVEKRALQESLAETKGLYEALNSTAVKHTKEAVSKIIIETSGQTVLFAETLRKDLKKDFNELMIVKQQLKEYHEYLAWIPCFVNRNQWSAEKMKATTKPEHVTFMIEYAENYLAKARPDIRGSHDGLQNLMLSLINPMRAKGGVDLASVLRWTKEQIKNGMAEIA